MDNKIETLESEVADLVVMQANLNAVGIINIAKQTGRTKAFIEELTCLNKIIEKDATTRIAGLIDAKRNAINSLRSQP
jgi:cyanate lyase